MTRQQHDDYIRLGHSLVLSRQNDEEAVTTVGNTVYKILRDLKIEDDGHGPVRDAVKFLHIHSSIISTVTYVTLNKYPCMAHCLQIESL
jgi:hypothetical protein